MYVSKITLYVNGSNALIKGHGVAEWIKKTRPIHMLSTRVPPLNKKYRQTKSKGMEKDISCKWKGGGKLG